MRLVSRYTQDYGMMMQVLEVMALVDKYESKGCSKATAIELAREELMAVAKSRFKDLERTMFFINQAEPTK